MQLWLPVVAGCVSPGFCAWGLFTWKDCWKHDALSLNAFKSSLASLLFAVLVVAMHRRPVAADVVAWLALSSFLGIVVSDTLWLESLRLLGARRMIAIDASKPFVAAFFGYALLGDRVAALGYLGVVLTTVGIFLLNRERQGAGDEEEDGDDEKAESTRGYALAFANVLCDVYAATITVAKHGRLTSEETNLVRFGLASAALLFFVGAKRHRSGRGAESSFDDLKAKGGDDAAMTTTQWRRVVFGVFLVTFLTPLVLTWTMFVLPLSVALTLSSLTPIWSLPVGLRHGEPITRLAAAGAALAVGGVACLAFAVT